MIKWPSEHWVIIFINEAILIKKVLYLYVVCESSSLLITPPPTSWIFCTPSITRQTLGRSVSIITFHLHSYADERKCLHYFLAISTTNWAQILTWLLFCALCWHTPSENNCDNITKHVYGCVRLASLGRPRYVCGGFFYPRTNVGNYLQTFILKIKKNRHTPGSTQGS